QNLSTGGHLSYVYVAPSLNSGNLLNAVLLYEPLTNHNRDGCNVLFADGHVEFFSGSTAQQMISQLQSGMNPPPIFRQQ
ncbi:MAG TPA: H-X9-DG-CTERM domain-containing protein, partial [Tepidisphaeraceae bacterium]|nr:H-X9-DG-CTERM domain-containing protein [Tepidisphaeraceae bacterium]